MTELQVVAGALFRVCAAGPEAWRQWCRADGTGGDGGRSGDIGRNTGDIVSVGMGIAAEGREISDPIRATASGRIPGPETLGHGEIELVPSRIGAVM